MVRASLSLATPPSVPEDSITIPDSSTEMLKSIWRKELVNISILFTYTVFTSEIIWKSMFLLSIEH